MKKILVLIFCFAAFGYTSGQTKSSFISVDSISKFLQQKHAEVVLAENALKDCKDEVEKLERNSKKIVKLNRDREAELNKIKEAEQKICDFAEKIGAKGDFGKYMNKQDLLKQCIIYSLSEQYISDLDSEAISKNAILLNSDDSSYVVSRIGILSEAIQMSKQLFQLLNEFKDEVLISNSWIINNDAKILLDDYLKKSDYYNKYYLSPNNVKMRSVANVIDGLLALTKDSVILEGKWNEIVSKLKPSPLKFKDLQGLYTSLDNTREISNAKITKIENQLYPLSDAQKQIEKKQSELKIAEELVDAKKKEHDNFIRLECINKVLKARCDSAYIAKLLPVVYADSCKIYLELYKKFYKDFVPMLENYRQYHVDFAKIAIKWYNKAKKVSGWKGITPDMSDELKSDLEHMPYWDYYYHRNDSKHGYASITYLDKVIDDYLIMKKGRFTSESQYLKFMERISEVKKQHTPTNGELKSGESSSLQHEGLSTDDKPINSEMK